MNRAQLLFLVTLTVSVSSVARAQQVCVSSTYEGLGANYLYPSGSTSDPIFDTQLKCDFQLNPAYCGWRAQADHTTGTFLTSCAGSSCSSELAAHAYAMARFTDSYTLIGPGSEPVAITPIVTAHLVSATGIFDYGPDLGRLCTSGGGKARLVRPSVDSVGVQMYGCPGPLDLTQDLSLSVLAVPGVPFDLTVALESYGGCFIPEQSTASLRFENVPQGYYIISCKGFLSGVVPTRTTSWGQLKQIYR